MKTLVVILLMALVFVLARLVLYKKDIRNLKDELTFIKDGDYNSRRLIGSGDIKDINRLRSSINDLLEEKYLIKSSYMDQEEKNKEIIASISHDLRTPLTSIKGYTELLDRLVEDEKGREYLDIIRKRSELLSNLINTFYELSKFEAKSTSEKLEYVDLKEILTSTIASNYESFVSKGIEPSIGIEDGKFSVLGDYKSIERIFGNLVDNAIKYSDSQVAIDLFQEDGRIKTRFKNDNKDLREEDIEKLFNKFFIMDTSRQSESTGLGLFITKELVTRLGYDIVARLDGNKIEITIDWTG